LKVTSEELQGAADAFRTRQALASPAQTNGWLDQQGMSAPDLADTLTADLLIGKLFDRLTPGRVMSQFDADPEKYSRVRLRRLVVQDESTSVTLLGQIRSGARDFNAAAAQVSPKGSPSTADGEASTLFRSMLPAPIASAVFAAKPGEVVGPFSTSRGFQLLSVEELQVAHLDDATADYIRRELLTSWLAEQSRRMQIDPEFSGLL
jgi:parvulin-like peptidyl-prolyl isomerase